MWLFSEPVHLGTVTVRADGTVRVTLPASAPAGAHRVAVVASDGTLIGWAPIPLQASATGRLATTGAGDMTATALGAVLLLGLGGAGIVLGRRRSGARTNAQ